MALQPLQSNSLRLSCNIQNRNFVCDQNRTPLAGPLALRSSPEFTSGWGTLSPNPPGILRFLADSGRD